MSSPVRLSLPTDLWSFMKILPPAETAKGQVNCLRTATSPGPQAEIVFAGRWDTKDGLGKRKR